MGAGSDPALQSGQLAQRVAIRIIVAVLRVVPIAVFYVLGWVLGSLLYLVSRRYRRLLFRNLDLAYGDELSRKQKRWIASSGLHSNGYSLVRKICFDILKLKIDTHVPELGKTIGKELLIPTKIYSKSIRQIIRDLHVLGIAHITGGGIEDNILRIIPKACNLVIRKGTWDVPPIFPFLQQAAKISDHEMRRTFNNGIGMAVIVSEKDVQDVLERLNGMKEKAVVIGEIIKKKKSDPRVQWI